MQQSLHEHSIPSQEECPYCGHAITHDELTAIQTRIADEESKKYKLLKADLEKRHKAELLVREVKAEALGTQKAEEKMKSRNEKWLKEQQALVKAQNKREAELHAQSEKLVAKQKATASEKVAMEVANKAALDDQKEVLETHYEKKILSFKAEREKENHRYQTKLADIQRQLEKKSNEELGDGAEVDVFNDLKAAFPDDVIRRVKKGAAGADIIHEIHTNGRSCGKIVYDSKNRAQWRTAYVEQLRQDQLAEKADYAVLPTRKFSKGVREMARQDGVIIINPARVVVIAGVLRDAIEQLSRAKLSEKGKQKKRDQLYEFLTSTRCADLFARVEETIEKLRDVDEKELKQQRSIRKSRGGLLSEVEKTILGDLQREIEEILGGTIYD